VWPACLKGWLSPAYIQQIKFHKKAISGKYWYVTFIFHMHPIRNTLLYVNPLNKAFAVKPTVAQLLNKTSHFIYPKVHICVHKVRAGSYPEARRIQLTVSHSIYTSAIILLTSVFRVCLWNIKHHSFPIPPVRAKCHAHFVLLEFIIQIISGE
jgi:hypothetical protein